MRKFLFVIIFAAMVMNAKATKRIGHINMIEGITNVQATDTVTLSIDGTSAYYQKTVRVDTSIGISAMYLRSLEFMAAKNYQQTYGYQEQGKLIFTTTQDLNTNAITTGSDVENTEVFSVQFAVTLDLKKHRYRYTIHNVIFFRPTENGNLRVPLYDMYEKETNGDAKWIRKDAKKVIDSFERYITNLTSELHESIEHKAAIYNSKF